jgi:hypothetical protein
MSGPVPQFPARAVVLVGGVPEVPPVQAESVAVVPVKFV